MTPKQFEAWARTRVNGRERYILMCGLLTWSVPFFLLTMAFFLLLAQLNLNWVSIAICLLLSLVAAYGFGALNWSFKEDQFGKEKIRREQ